MSDQDIDKSFAIDKTHLYRIEGGQRQRISAAVRVSAFAKISGGAGSLAEIQLLDIDGCVQTVFLPRRELLTLQSLMAALVDAGFQPPVSKEHRKAIYEYLAASKPGARRLLTGTVGWAKNQFVLPEAVIRSGSRSQVDVVYRRPENGLSPLFGVRGSLDAWQANVASLAITSSTLVFSCCLALGAPLLRMCEQEGGGVHLVGPSSIGKTLALLVARSISGDATREDLLPWRTTSNALDAIAFAYNDTLLCLDDTDQLPGSEQSHAELMRQAAHTLANGRGKMRLSAFGKGVAQELNWKVSVLSGGVRSLAEIVKSSGSPRLASEEVRLADLPCHVSEQHGIFEALPNGCSTLEKAIALIEDGCRNSHGQPLRHFLQAAISLPRSTQTFVDMRMAAFVDKSLSRKADAWEQRFIKKFAFAFAAGALACIWKVLPWTEEQVFDAVMACYRRARAAVPSAVEMSIDGMDLLDRLAADRSKTLVLGSVRRKDLKRLRDDAPRAVLIETGRHGRHLVISPKVFREVMGSARKAQLTIQRLFEQRRLIQTDPRVPTSQRKFAWDPRRRRYYFIAMSGGANDRGHEDLGG